MKENSRKKGLGENGINAKTAGIKVMWATGGPDGHGCLLPRTLLTYMQTDFHSSISYTPEYHGNCPVCSPWNHRYAQICLNKEFKLILLLKIFLTVFLFSLAYSVSMLCTKQKCISHIFQAKCLNTNLQY